MKEPKFIVVVGASAGGLHSIIELSAQLKKESNIAVFVVLHVSHMSMPDVLLQRIQKHTELNCSLANDGEQIESGKLYMAVPDKHLLVKDGKVLVGEGAIENRWRPSIDVLFRSAAASFGNRVIGIVLTGLLQDGTSGMMAIKKAGGTCIVQDPEEAEFPDMPNSVIKNVQVDHCVPLQAMGDIISEKTRNGTPDPEPVPKEVVVEADISERVAIGIQNVMQLGVKSLFSCPDCGGGLWEIKEEGLTRFRCHTGHTYTAADLMFRQQEELERTIWIALRILEERRMLLEKISDEEDDKGWTRMAAVKKQRAKEMEEHIERLKNFLFDSKLN